MTIVNILRRAIQSTAFNVVAAMAVTTWGVYLIEPAQENDLLALLGGFAYAAGVLWLRDTVAAKASEFLKQPHVQSFLTFKLLYIYTTT